MLPAGESGPTVGSAGSAGSAENEAASARPERWATPLARDGLPNLHQVAPGLYRGAQPTAEGMQALERLGVRTVVNLRAFHSDRSELAGTALAYEHIHFNTWHPEDEDVLRFLAIVRDPARQPVFVHCQHGADRTGTMCAIYRMMEQGWTVEDAIAEMTTGGFNFHAIWGNLPKYLRALDLAALRRTLGIAAP